MFCVFYMTHDAEDSSLFVGMFWLFSPKNFQ